MARLLVLPLVLGLSACSWTRFDDLESDPPVVLLKKPTKLKAGFGVFMSVASSEGDKSTRVLIGGANDKNPAATFELGKGTRPKLDAIDTGTCIQPTDRDSPCYLADRAAGLGLADVGGAEPDKLCFVFGLGQAEVAPAYGLMGRCASTVEYTLPVPERVRTELIENEVRFQDHAAPLVIASDKSEAAGVVAGASKEEQRLAWFYPPLSNNPVELIPPGEPDLSFGSAVAIVRVGTEGAERRVIAVGAPEAGHVWLFDQGGRPLGCLGSPTGFGRSLASGHVDADELDELVIADDVNVTVISGEALAALGPTNDVTCSLAALTEGALIASFSCGSRQSVAGCPGDFGAGLDVGDLDGDGDGEVIVGAPDMSVRGTKRAGAVLVYDAEGPNPELLTDVLFLSSQESDDQLGRSVVAAPIEGRDVVVAGAPGNGRAAVFYCSVLLEGGGSRCE